MKLYSVTTSPLKIIAGTIGVSHDQLVGRAARLRVLREIEQCSIVEVMDEVEFKATERVYLSDQVADALPAGAVSLIDL